jgi:peptidoglycan-associated lipoprotein
MSEPQSLYRVMAALLLAGALVLGGCAHKRPKFVPNSTPNAAESGAQGAGAGGANATGGAEDEAAGPQGGLLATRLVYFDFDSSEIKGQGTDVVAAHAKYLAANPGARVRLEGHTDERGSREYNIGLRRALLLQGASDAQISTVSYGQERPAAPGHDETAWAKNRRVEIVYLTPAGAPPPKQ